MSQLLNFRKYEARKIERYEVKKMGSWDNRKRRKLGRYEVKKIRRYEDMN